MGWFGLPEGFGLLWGWYNIVSVVWVGLAMPVCGLVAADFLLFESVGV